MMTSLLWTSSFTRSYTDTNNVTCGKFEVTIEDGLRMDFASDWMRRWNTEYFSAPQETRSLAVKNHGDETEIPLIIAGYRLFNKILLFIFFYLSLPVAIETTQNLINRKISRKIFKLMYLDKLFFDCYWFNSNYIH